MDVPTGLALAGVALMGVALFAWPTFGQRPAAGADARPTWPQLVAPTATACDVPARLDLVDALGSLGSPWAIGVLHHASEDETDPAVRTAIDAALASSEALASSGALGAR